MRRFLFGVVIASITTAMPTWAFGGDREIAKAVMTELKQQKAAGYLKGFDIDMKVEDGIVYLTGKVASVAQRDLVARSVDRADGVVRLVNDLAIDGGRRSRTDVGYDAQSSAVTPASATEKSAQPTRTDMAITDAIIGKLQQSKASGRLRGFELDVSTVGGDVWLRGKVANDDQKQHVIDVARRIRGVARVIDDIAVAQGGPVLQASTQQSLTPAPAAPAPVPQAPQQASSMPVMGNGQLMPQAFAPSGLANYQSGGQAVQGTPVAMQHGAGMTYGAGAPRYDQPNMPSYAWPSYAAYPNYSAVTYPKQYSPSAWPYIGPFYPYPQVPLGWRKVSLEWDDGLWYLDFTSK